VKVVDVRQAIVRRIVQAWVAGSALKKIAAALNNDGVLAPRDASKGGGGLKAGKGWGHTSVRSILQAERYVGRFTWNTSEFVRHPERKWRTRRARDPKEWVTVEKPELAIIDGELWRAAAARFRRVEREGPARTWGTGRRDGWLLSGLCRCAECGAGVAIRSRKAKGNREFARVQCTGATSRGNCSARCVAETRLVRALVENLQQQLSAPELAEAFVAGFVEEYRELKRQHEATGGAVAAELRAAERKVKAAGDPLAQHHERTGTWSAALGERLAAAEAELAAARGAVAAAREGARAEVPTLPPVPELRAALTKVAAVIGADKVQARAALGAYLHQGKLALDTRRGEVRLTGTLDIGGAVKSVAGARFELAAFGL
jgi:site-specific DNA recombinase